MGISIKSDWLVQIFQPTIAIYKRGNFVSYHWGCLVFFKGIGLKNCLKQTQD